ncbi:MAG TPA: sigma-54-dependent Fis family transcriptional regulator [candidate division Zixibacteria bacterium]|nr:sigma-54-dependent Fis family transcriptional regulator [candidate division Zixibacteria bacterium]
MMKDSEPKGRILIVDDEESMQEFLDIMLTREGYDVETVGSFRGATNLMAEKQFDVIVSDIKMPGGSGLELLKKARSMDPNTTVIMMTAYASLQTAVEALRDGAFDYITKPFEVSQIKYAISRAFENKKLRDENRILKQKIRSSGGAIDDFIAVSKAGKEMKELVKKIAPSDSSVLITGESGTGKEVIAKAIHALSSRSDGPFLAINCGAVPEQLLESELFGHKKGSFTGAFKDKIGLLEAANGGTFLLDEVGTTSPTIQIKLLRALEEREITAVGATQPTKIDVRLLAATNSNLEAMAADGSFREDLYYRLNVFHVHIPPLRERREDIVPVAKFILDKIAGRTEEPAKILSEETAELLEKAPWKGNVRELENVLERALLMADGAEILPKHLPECLRGVAPEVPKRPLATFPDEHLPSIETIEKAYIFWVLMSNEWKKARAAEILGIDASTLYRKIEKYGLKDYEPE